MPFRCPLPLCARGMQRVTSESVGTWHRRTHGALLGHRGRWVDFRVNLERDPARAVRRPGRQTGVDAIVELRHVSVHYPIRSTLFRRSAQVIRAVDDVSLTINEGGSVGLVGDTGSGKSTVAQLIVGMVEPTAGLVSVAGREPSRL